MDQQAWKIAQTLLRRALDLAPEERATFLDEECPDPQVRSEVDGLLDAHAAAGSFLEEPLADPLKTPTAPPRPPPDDLRFGPYRVVDRIGAGGMGTVYLAVRDDDQYSRRVAIKVAQAGTAHASEILRRFRRERQILAALDHPNIARLFDGGATADGLPYFVMEFVEGLPIDEYCRREHLSLKARIKLFQTVCEAVQYAHANLVVHRDLKPANVIVTSDGVAKLLDFGIAKLLNPELGSGSQDPTRLGLAVATPRYSSPEQIRGEPVTTSTDVYSLGVLLFEMLVGRPPFSLDELSLPQAARVICETEPPRPSRIASESAASALSERSDEGRTASRRLPAPTDLRGDLDSIVLKALRKEPRRRYSSAERMSLDLQRYLDGRPVSARPDSLSYRTGKFLRRHRVAAGLGAAFLLAVLGFGVVTSVQNVRITEQRDRAFREAAKVRAVKVEAMKRIAKLLHQQGQTADAEDLYRETLELERGLLPENHPDIAMTLRGLADLLRDQGRPLEAAPLYRRALRALERVFPDGNELVAETRGELGGCLVLASRGDEAEEHLLTAYSDLAAAAGPEDLRTIRVANWLARLYANTGRHGEAATFQALAVPDSTVEPMEAR